MEKLNNETAAPAINTTLGTLEVREMEIRDVLDRISSQSGLDIVIDEEIAARVTIFLKDVNVFDALRIILDTSQLAYTQEALPDGRQGLTVHVMTAATFESRFGYPFSQKVQTRIIALAHAQAEVVGALLDKMKSDAGKVIYSEGARSFILIDAPESLKSMEELIRKLDVPVEPRTFTLRYVKAKDMAQRIQGFLTENVGRIDLGGGEEQMTIVDTPSHIGEVARRIEELDQPDTEVLLEAKILQIILNDEYRQGVDWEAIVSDYQSLEFAGFEASEAAALRLGTVNEEDYMVLLDALDAVGVINTVSNLKIAAADRQPAEIVIRSSDLLTDFERQEEKDGAVGKKDVVYRVVSRMESGNEIALEVQPQLAGDEDTGERKAVTLKLQGGTTVVVGGLFKEVTLEATRKIPLLGDLPFLGFAFRIQGERSSDTEIIVFLTPKVIVKE